VQAHLTNAQASEDSPHASAVLEGVGAALERPPKVGVHLVLPLAALVDERELEERAHIRALAGEGYEEGDVGGAVLRALPVGVEVDRPVESPHGEGLGGDILPHPDTLG